MNMNCLRLHQVAREMHSKCIQTHSHTDTKRLAAREQTSFVYGFIYRGFIIIITMELMTIYRVFWSKFAKTLSMALR